MTRPQEDAEGYRLARARESLEDATILAGAGRWNTCVNRLYYACFYAVSALLLRHSLSATKHTGVRSLFNQHFVRTGRTPRQIAQTYNDLFERRQESDYLDFVDFEEDQVRPLISRARDLLGHVSALLASDAASRSRCGVSTASDP